MTGVWPDPQFGRNQLEVFHSNVADTFVYSRTVDTPGVGCAVANQRRCELVFDGIDTAAEVVCMQICFETIRAYI